MSDETDVSSSLSTPTFPKRKKLLKKRMRGVYRKNSLNHRRSISISSNESYSGFDSKKIKKVSDVPISLANKSKKLAFYRNEYNNETSAEEDVVDEEERSYCSSISPQPLGDRLPPLKEHENLIKMGGVLLNFLLSNF